VNCELTGELRSYSWDARNGTLQLVQSLSPYPAGYAGEKSAAELVVSRDGRFLYVSLRGDEDSILVYAIDARKGTLSETQRVPSGGKTPWSMGIDPTGRWLLVTNQASDSVAVFNVDPATGRLGATNESVEVPDPMAVAFYPN
jgi:6-phosphogluconolactonase